MIHPKYFQPPHRYPSTPHHIDFVMRQGAVFCHASTPHMTTYTIPIYVLLFFPCEHRHNLARPGLCGILLGGSVERSAIVLRVSSHPNPRRQVARHAGIAPAGTAQPEKKGSTKPFLKSYQQQRMWENVLLCNTAVLQLVCVLSITRPSRHTVANNVFV